MKNNNPMHFSLFIILSFVLFSTGCTDSTTQESSTTPAEQIETVPDQIIETSNYIISIYEGSQGDLFSLQKPDQSYIASNITESEFMSDYPEAFEELTLNGISDGLDGNIYYDSPGFIRF